MTLYSPTPDKEHTKNMAVALVLCALLIVGWQFFVEIPKRAKLTEWQKQQQVLKAQQKEKVAQENLAITQEGVDTPAETLVPAEDIVISSEMLHGKISTRGLRFDHLTLANYHEELDPNSPEVQLLHKSNSQTPYFMQFGWLSDNPSILLPHAKTVWSAQSTRLAPGEPVMLSWENGQGITFEVKISLDKGYMFTIEQSAHNTSGQMITLKPYALINRMHVSELHPMLISHEGPIGVVDKTLKEIDYDTLIEEKQVFRNMSSWLGFTDKYWLTALIPNQHASFDGQFSSYKAKDQQRYQADYTGGEISLQPGEKETTKLHFFAGAKKVDLLDAYTAGVEATDLQPVPLFDRAVDFGWLYFLTKPIFQLLHYFYQVVGNFGIAIILLTFLIKLLMFPLANKGYKSMGALKKLQPEMTRLKEQYGNDRMKLQQEMLAMYKREKVNPASGCLPMLIQLPVFFALYKVLFVTIEMRHAAFWGPWQDLSAADPTNIFTLFGLVPWDTPGFLWLGFLPIMMALSMYVQMHLQPTPQDPVQAKVMKFMPLFLLILVARMPAGLVLYWVVSNILSILQQWVITRKYNEDHPKYDVP